MTPPPPAPADGGARARGHSLSFGRAVEEYERSRPGYPAAALDWVLPEGARRVADVGAGTGKLTRTLVARGLAVTAVEPDDAMRAELVCRVPGARALPGRGESLPLDDGSLDAVLFAQAWHWVDPGAGSAEVARVLAPGGRIGLLWNVRDTRVSWVGELGAIMARYAGSPDQGWEPVVTAPFGPLERRDVGWVHQLTPPLVLDMVASRSYVITLPPPERERLLGEVRDLVASHPDLAGRDVIDIPYLTSCYRASRP
jgi:SAM-dependent methyltransferase